MSKIFLKGVVATLFFQSGFLAAQEEVPEGKIDEIIVVGTQIKGAQISEALPITVMTDIDIEALGVNSGDELLEFMAEQGQNFFSEAENVSGGVNSARGDIGAINLRNLGTGNTLVLLNGRRMVNSAAYQTEEVGGSFVPVNTVNVQSLPVTGLQRVEVLKDGASAIYGADAVAGVLNYVLKNDFEGLRIGVRADTYESLPRDDQRFTVEWGGLFNDGRTSVGAFLNHYRRDRVNSQDDPRWANSDFRYRAPEPYNQDSNTRFRNDSINSNYGQYDIVSSVGGTGLTGVITDSSGEFETFPAGDPRCEYVINSEVCGAVDGNGAYRYNLNENRDLYAELKRTNVYSYVEHEMSESLEFFGELTWYNSSTNNVRDPATQLSAVAKLRIAEDAYYNPLGPVGSPNRLPDSVIGASVPATGLAMALDNYRFVQAPRNIDVDGDTYRIVTGLRGTLADEWDWEGALSWSKSEREDVTRGRISNTLMQEALNDTTAAGFNPFAPVANSNIERTLVDVYRKNEQELAMVDFKISNPSLFELPAGSLGFLAGLAYRDESFYDDRDPRLDGQITFVDNSGTTYPFISDVVGSSPTADSRGDRQVTSLFSELQIPVLENLDIQLALRYEDFSDVGNTTVGKFAFGYRFIEPILFRGSISQAFRAPNLVTINESTVARSNTSNDFTCFFVDPNEDDLDCRYGIQRTAQGSQNLKPEESINSSLGFVVDASKYLTVTVDFWRIRKEDTIGLFGEENHIALDLLMRLEAGNSNCAAFVGNPAVVRDDSSIDATAQALYDAQGICAAGEVVRVDDQYANLDTRTVKGHDIGFYSDFETDYGAFNIKYLTSRLSEYEQKAGGQAALLVAAKATNSAFDGVPVVGFTDLVGRNGNPRRKDTFRVRWDMNAFGASVAAVRYDDFIQVLSNDDEFPISSFTTFNVSFDYDFQIFNDLETSVYLGINNVADKRAPIADDSFGYFADQHTDLGRYYYTGAKFDLF
ncbi:MAG: TonB-dependent receptor domain-containing protein [Cellvibrionaceae bacterium]